MIDAAKEWTVTRTLRCQVPIIHFQHNQMGATLRATEVKPKLDRFLKKQYGKPVPPSWRVKNHDKTICALNYKLRLTALDPNAPKTRPHNLFYGNMGSDNPKKQVPGDIELIILCTNDDLRALIEKYIDEFFVITNFGTMQGKGFGSYVTDKPLSRKEIAVALCAAAGTKTCYYITGYRDGSKFNKRLNQSVPCTAQEFMLDDIKSLYSLMKGKYLLRYFQDVKEIGHEKTKLKENALVPTFGSGYQRDRRKTYRYVRALFGTCERVEYLQPGRDGKPDFRGRKLPVQMSHPTIQRFPSPIFFKIIGNTIYIVAREIDPAIYGESFTFTTVQGSVRLQAPTKGEFDIHAFMGWFAEEYGKAQARRERFHIRPNIQKWEVR